jgi:hypothetical protein
MPSPNEQGATPSMTLELTPTEAEQLQQALGSYLSELRMEIADTDSYDYRQGLKAKKATLSDVLARLEGDGRGRAEPADASKTPGGQPRRS